MSSGVYLSRIFLLSSFQKPFQFRQDEKIFWTASCPFGLNQGLKIQRPDSTLERFDLEGRRADSAVIADARNFG